MVVLLIKPYSNWTNRKISAFFKVTTKLSTFT